MSLILFLLEHDVLYYNLKWIIIFIQSICISELLTIECLSYDYVLYLDHMSAVNGIPKLVIVRDTAAWSLVLPSFQY